MKNLIEATAALAALRNLPVGWDYGRGGPISKSAFINGMILLKSFANLGANKFDIVPGGDDGAVVVAYFMDKSAEAHCQSNGSYDLIHEVSDGEEEIHDNLSLAELVYLLERYGWQSPRFFASCTRNVMFRESDDMPVSHLKIPQAVGCQSYARTVSTQRVVNRANTSKSFTTQKFAENRQSSGEYRSLPFPMAIA